LYREQSVDNAVVAVVVVTFRADKILDATVDIGLCSCRKRTVIIPFVLDEMMKYYETMRQLLS